MEKVNQDAGWVEQTLFGNPKGSTLLNAASTSSFSCSIVHA